MKLFRVLCVVIMLIGTHSFAQDSTLVPSNDLTSGIRVSARLAQQHVPLNRTLTFIIQVEWYGDLERYKISEVETPTVRNFTIFSNSSSDRREMVNGQMKAIKTFEFDLKPQELGMGYIDGVIVKYIDTETGEGQHLITNRLEAKVVDLLPEPGDMSKLYSMIGLGVIGLAVVVAVIIWFRRRQQIRRNVEPPPPPLEETYLTELKSSLSLNASDLNIKDGFVVVSRIYRRYLGEKYQFPATNALIDEITSVLSQNEKSERLIEITREVLGTCDVVKFSGGDGQKADLERVFTLVESVLQDELKAASESTNPSVA
ncbi:hypothetical protein JW960_23910 [candidate division KSB1 bacterium]|nr:hypothetical protein [candidate division KSB1 bacterium]